MTDSNYREILDLLCSLKNKCLVCVHEAAGQQSRDKFIKWNGKLIFISRLISYFTNEAPTFNQLGDVLNEQISYCLTKGKKRGRVPQYKILDGFYLSQAQLACRLLVDLANLSGGDI